MVFIGHVDAGKSTIGGQIMYLTNMVDKRTLEKYEKEAKEINRETWYLSWCMDTNAEERNKGKTVEVRGDFVKCWVLQIPCFTHYTLYSILATHCTIRTCWTLITLHTTV